MPALLKPGAARLLSMLKAIHEGDIERAVNPPPGLTSIPNDRRHTLADYAAAGFQPCGPRAVRLDMLERLADLIREQRSENKERRFEPNAPMTALLGCSNEDLREVLKALGYRRVQKAAEDQPELWSGRSRSTQRPAQTGQKPHAKGKGQGEGGPRTDARPRPAPVKDKPIDPDSPSAALAALELEHPKPANQKRRKPRKKSKAKPAEAKTDASPDQSAAEAPETPKAEAPANAAQTPADVPVDSDAAGSEQDRS